MNFYCRYGKRLLDVTAATSVLLVLALPLGLIAVIVRWRLGSPVYFRQQRPGLDERPFKLIKFRTMTDARDASGRLLSDSDRLTPLGRFLRKSSIDELPELWNVLKGEMSLVGPRPLLSEYLPHYTPRESLRHSVRPGITGLAQVSGRNSLGWDERLDLDARYVERLTLGLDVWILWRTFWGVVRSSGVSADSSLVESNLAQERSLMAVDRKEHS